MTDSSSAGDVIRMRDVHRVFEMGDSKVRAVDGVSLDVNRGEFLAIMGSSGSGKSTLMNILGCLDTPTSGRYELSGRSVGQLEDDALAAIRNCEIGFVFQTFNLLPRLTAAQNIELPLVYAGLPAAERHQRAAELLELVKLGARGDHRPNQLSGGQRQRVAIARALVHRPSLILADEPTGNLDSKTSEEIMALFRELHGLGNTLVMVTHDDDVAAEAKRIVRMRDGEIVEDVSHAA